MKSGDREENTMRQSNSPKPDFALGPPIVGILIIILSIVSLYFGKWDFVLYLTIILASLSLGAAQINNH